MTTNDAILDIVNMFGLTIEQALNFIAAMLFIIVGLMMFHILVPIVSDLINFIDSLIKKIKAKKEAKKNANNKETIM